MFIDLNCFLRWEMWPIGHLFVFMGQTLTYVLKQIECTNCTFTSISGFQCLAHLSWKLKWASDYLLSVHMSVLNFSHFHLLDQFQPNLAQSILGWRRFKFVQMKGHALFQGEILMKYQNTFNTQVPSSDVITSLCWYSFVSEAWKVFVYVNGGASARGEA